MEAPEQSRTSRVSARSILAASVVLLGALVIIYFPALFLGRTILPTDEYLMTYKPFDAAYPTYAPFNHFDDDILKLLFPYVQAARDHLYRPGWEPRVFGGYPIYANTYASHFSTLNWILPLGPLSYTYPLRVMASEWIAGVAMFTFVTWLGAAFLPALVSGLAYMFSSLFVTMLLRWWIPGAYSWFPLLLLFTASFFRDGRRSAAPWAALVLAASFLDGFFQTSASIVLAWGFFAVLVAESWRSPRTFLRFAGFCTVVGTAAILLSAVMWLPQLEYFHADLLKGSSRAAGNVFGKNLLERVLSAAMLPVGAFFPQALGSVRTLDLTKLARTHLQDFSLFLGTIPLLAGLCAFSLRKDPLRRALSLLLLFGLFVPAMTFLDRFLYFRFLAVYLAGMAALAGLGLDELRGDRVRERRVLRAGGLFWAALGLGALALRAFLVLRPGILEEKIRAYLAARLDQTTIGSRQPAWMLERGQAFLRQLSLRSWEFNVPFLVVGLSLVIWFLWQKNYLSKRIFLLGSFALVLVQSWLTVHLWFPFSELKRYPLYPPNEITEFLRRADPRGDFRAHGDDFAGGITKPQVLPVNSNVGFGFSFLDGFDGVRPLTAVDERGPGYPGLADFNVKYVVTAGDARLQDPSPKLVWRGGVAIYELSGVAARGRVTDRYVVVPDGLKGEPGVGDRPIRLEEAPGIPAGGAGLAAGSAQLESDEGNRVVYDVRADHPALFVSTESYYPGWKAFWNGEEKKVLRANGALRAVALPAGQGTLEFRFEPDSYRIGLLVTIFSALLWILWAAWLNFFRREHHVFSK